MRLEIPELTDRMIELLCRDHPEFNAFTREDWRALDAAFSRRDWPECRRIYQSRGLTWIENDWVRIGLLEFLVEYPGVLLRRILRKLRLRT